MARVLIVLTSCTSFKHDNKDKPTGWYLPEIAHPFEKFKESGCKVVFASPKGGLSLADPDSVKDYAKDKICETFKKAFLNEKNELRTVKMSTIDPKLYDVIFFAGGHGTMFDFPDDNINNNIAKEIYENGGIVSAVCHGPAALVNIKLSNNEYLISNKHVTGFTNDEETAMKLHKSMPFLLESKLKERGCKFIGQSNWKDNCVVDDRIVTGQNPASATSCAIEIIKILKKNNKLKNNEIDDEKKEIEKNEKKKIKILMVVTSECNMGKTNKPTGWYLPEIAHPYHEFINKGYDIIFASPKGGLTKSDPGGNENFKNDDICNDFVKKCLNDKKELNTVKISTLNAKNYDCIFYAGGHGTMYDFPKHNACNDAARIVYESGGIVAAVCHGPAGLVNVKLSNGEYLIKGKRVTGFTNDEEKTVKLDEIMPFLLESKLKERGAMFVGQSNWKSNCVVDDRLITGQNPASSTACAKEIIKLIESKKNNIKKEDEIDSFERARINMYCHAYSDKIKQVLLDPIQIANKCKEMGAEITNYYNSLNDGKTLLVIGLLRGAFVFISDLAREIKVQHQVDFMMVKSYAGTRSTNVKILLDMNIDPEDKHVLIVEDLVDTGKTLMWLEKHMEMKRAASVKKAVLLKKKTKRLHKDFQVKLDFIGFTIDDHWICGYGMDYMQKYRALGCIVILKESTYSNVDKKHLGIKKNT